ncbi:MAG: hypothetical protein PHS99_08410 [Candidatus Marinimicrobia bacterium]|nr:hypothetical protein [Candidatus Neomarinimicrobiota bacterium]
MSDHDNKKRDSATNKLLNILQTEPPKEEEKKEKLSHPTDEISHEIDIDSKKLTDLFDKTTGKKKENVEKEEQLESNHPQEEAQNETEKEPFSTISLADREETFKTKAETRKEQEEVSEKEEPSVQNILFDIQKASSQRGNFGKQKTNKHVSFLIQNSEEELSRVGPFVAFKKRFESEKPFLFSEVLSTEKSSKTEESLNDIKNKKTSQEGKSIFDILDEYIETKKDDIILPLKESKALSLETEVKSSESREKNEKGESYESQPLIHEETREEPKSSTQKNLYQEFEKETRNFEDLRDEEEEERIFDEKFNSIPSAIKPKISEISNWLSNKHNIIAIETDETSARYLQAVPEGTKIKITNWGYLTNWNISENITEEEKQKLFLKSISRQINHKKGFITYFTHSRNYISRVHTFQNLNKKETREALKWAVTKNLPFLDKAIEYDVKPISSDTVDEKSYFTLIAPHNLVSQEEKLFYDVGMIPRQITTIPYLAAKAFRLNYPDYFKETAIIFYIGETYSNLIFIKNHEFHFEREFNIGQRDLLNALHQEVNTLEGKRKLSDPEALLLLDTYGFGHNKNVVIKELGIDYSIYFIMIRPIAERIIMEISRSIDYYRKTFSLLADGDVFLVGPGAIIPGVRRFIEDQLGRKTSILNPMRTDIFAYKYKDAEIPEQLLPCYTLHLAAAFPEKDLNIITKGTRNREHLIATTKLSRIILICFLIFAALNTHDMLIERNNVKSTHQKVQKQWQNISDVSATFMAMTQKEQTYNKILNQVREDQYSTDRTLMLLKMLSNVTPPGIYLTDFRVEKPDRTNSNQTYDFILKGYITRNPSVTDIYLNNYLSKFKDTGFFESISLSVNDEQTDTGTQRSFTITGVLK